MKKQTMDKDILKRAFERIDKLRSEGKLPKINPNDWDDEPTALAYTPDDKFYFGLNMYTEGEVDNIVYTLIDKFLNHNGSYSDNEKLKDLYQQIKKKMNISEMFEGPSHNLVWKNRYNEIMEDAFRNYKKNAVVGDIVDSHYEPATDKWHLYIKEEFINLIKKDERFAKKWGVKITERELTLEERYNKWFNNNYETGMERYFDPNNLPDFDNEYYYQTPTKEITLEYKEERVIYYE